MPRHMADGTAQRLPKTPIPSLGLSAMDAACIGQLVGHTLAAVECELIIQTLRLHQGNRTRAANVLGISVRSLRDRIRIYRNRGESVPEPRSSPTVSD
jgi:DNA-binding NtrC family response regulator